MKLLEKDVELISSKRPIDNAMLSPPLRPWQRTINLTRNTNTNENRPLPVIMVVISLHVRVVSANDPANDTNTITIKNTITKFRYLQPLLRLKLKFLTDTFCKQFCTNTNTIMITKKPLLELMEKWDVELFVNTIDI